MTSRSENLPDEAVEAAAKAIYESEGDSWSEGTETARDFSRVHARAALAATAPLIAAQATSDLAALIDEAESRHGSSMYCKVTTYELRKALGQDVSDWPKRSES